MRRFAVKLAFDALDKRRTLNGDRFRSEIFSHFGLSQGFPVPIEELWPRIEDLLAELRRFRWSRFERDAAADVCNEREERAIADAYGHGYRLHEIAVPLDSLIYSEPQTQTSSTRIEQCGIARPGPRRLLLPFMS